MQNDAACSLKTRLGTLAVIRDHCLRVSRSRGKNTHPENTFLAFLPQLSCDVIARFSREKARLPLLSVCKGQEERRDRLL